MTTLSQAGIGPSGPGSPIRRHQPRTWRLALEATSLGLLTVILAFSGLLLVLIPQRIAQRPGQAGVIVVHLERSGGLRLWNQPISEASLFPLLWRGVRDRRPLQLRLITDAGVPWGRVQDIAARARALPVPLELQLP